MTPKTVQAGLFGHAPDRAGAYGRPAPIARAIRAMDAEEERRRLSEIAAAVVAEHRADLVARARKLEEAIRRALEQLGPSAGPGEAGSVGYARAVLATALAWSPPETTDAKGA